MNIKKNYFIVILIIVSAICLINFGFPTKVKAYEVTPFAYYDPNSVSFKGTYNGTSNYYDGNYMAFEARATASDGKTHEVIVSVYIVSTNTTKNYKIYTDGITRKADYIPIGSGSSAIISAKCSDSSVTVNLDLKMYSW